MRDFLLGFLIFLAYLHIPLPSGFYFPAFFLLVVAVVSLLVKYSSVTYNDGRFLTVILSLVFILLIITPGIAYFGDKLLSLVQFSISLFISIVTYNYIRTTKFQKLDRIFYYLILIIIFGTFLEIIGVIRGVSDIFRSNLIDGTLYSDDLRDIRLTGHVRPNFFSAEPSFVSILFLVVINSYLLLRVNYYNKPKYIFIASSYIYIFWALNSPILMLSLVMSLIIVSKVRISLLIKYFIISITLVSLIIFIYENSVFEILYKRISSGLTGGEGSFTARILRPYITLYDVLESYPLLGVGFGGKEIAADLSRFSFLRNADHIIGDNAFTHFLMYFGLFGSFLIYISFANFFSFNQSRNLFLFFSYYFLLSNTIGGLETARYLVFLFVFAAVIKKSENKTLIHVSVPLRSKWKNQHR